MLAVTARRPAVLLTPRELEVVDLLRLGLAPKEIAARLQISVWTVRRHIDNGIRRNGARSSHHLVGLLVRARETPRTN